VLSAPANGDGGWVRGIEVSGAIEFGKFASFLDGFGAQGSISHSKYKLKPAAEAVIPVLPGFSAWTYNITGYYEKHGFQARASYRYRDAFQGEVIALFSNPGFPQILADKQLDAQIGYTFQPGSRMDGLGILLQVSNVLNSPYRTSYTVGPNNVNTLENFEQYGRQWLLGVSYHFPVPSPVVAAPPPPPPLPAAATQTCADGSVILATDACPAPPPPPPAPVPERGW
jgi:iron complex outermembrane receptor protein